MTWVPYKSWFVEGVPKGQGRPRAVSAGKHARVYNPSQAKPWRERIIYGSMPHRPDKPFVGGVRVDASFDLPRPKRLMRVKDPFGRIPHTSKPDRDNLDKVLLDALVDCGMLHDDCVVCKGTLEKFYCEKDGRPGVTISVHLWAPGD